ncbi:MAG: hypothetical protein E7513_06765 [Ruminococcaceae bacterium]|nr:hypothetical protein [Oscillospiraceae bacterium]
MIVINSGKMTIPEEERFIGFAGDNLHSTKQFLLIGISEQNCIYRLYLTFDDGTTNYFVLDSEVVDDSTHLTWNIETGHIFKSGTVKAQIKSIAEDGEIYHTNSDFFLVGHTAEFNPSFKDTENSEFLKYEKELNELIGRLDEGLNEVVPTSRKIAGINLKDDITASELRNSLKTHPILALLNETPTESTVGEEYQLLVSYKNEEYKLYMCVNKIGEGDCAKYEWELLNEKPDLRQFVPISTKIAGLALNRSLTEVELMYRLHKYLINFSDKVPTSKTFGSKGQIIFSTENGVFRVHYLNDVDYENQIYDWVDYPMGYVTNDEFEKTVGDIETLLEELL